MAVDSTKDPIQQAIVDAETEAAARKAARDAADAEEAAALKAAQDAELAGVQAYNTAQYDNLGQIVGDIQSKIDAAKQKDETAIKRENAYRYISGLGDTISSLANLVGTAYGAANQKQVYNSHAVVQKAEEARKARKLEMDELSKRMDEMKIREREMKAAGSLKEAELLAKQRKEKMTLKTQQEEKAREAEYQERMLAVNEMNAQTSRMNAEKKKPSSSSSSSSRIVKVMGANGKMKDFDVSGYKDFDKAYQKALDAAIAAGTSGLTEDEITAYQNAVKLAKVDSTKALNEFLRTHTYRQNIVDMMTPATVLNRYNK